MSRDIPIIFSAPMVRALLDGKKTQTRRLFKPKGVTFISDERGERFEERDERRGGLIGVGPLHITDWIGYSRYAVGDRLWVRENHQFRGADYGDSGDDIEWFRCYSDAAVHDSWDPNFPSGWEPSAHMGIRELTDPDEKEDDGVTGYVTKLLPSIHMPRWASRLTLIVEGVKVERLQDISEADAIAEGASQYASSTKILRPFNPDWKGEYRAGFMALWDSLHGTDSWDANPFVVALTFRVERANIDALTPQPAFATEPQP